MNSSIVFLIIVGLIIIIPLIIFRHFYSYERVINPVYMPFDMNIQQLIEANAILSQSILYLTTQQTNLQSQVTNASATLTNLQNTLNVLIQEQTTQNTSSSTPQTNDPELLLISQLYNDIKAYMTANFSSTDFTLNPQNYVVDTPFYNGINQLIQGYLQSTSLSLAQFNATYTDQNALNFRQAIQDIYTATSSYDFGTFDQNLSSFQP